MIALTLLIFTIGFYSGFNGGKDQKKKLSYNIGLSISVVVFSLYYILNEETHPLYGTDTADYMRNDHVILPDSTSGKIEQIYYLVEGEIYPETKLKSSER